MYKSFIEKLIVKWVVWTRSLATQFVIYTTAIVVGAALFAFILNMNTEKDKSRAIYVNHLVNFAKNISQIASAKFMLGNDIAPVFNSKILSENNIAFAGIYEPLHEETIVLKLSDSYKSDSFDELTLNRLRRFAGFSASTDTTQVIELNDNIVVATPMNEAVNGGSIYLIVSNYTPPSMMSLLFSRSNITILLTLLALSIPFTMVAGKRMLGSLHYLTQATALAAEGYLDIELETKKKDEIGILSRSFQHMIVNLRNTFEQINNLAFVDSITGLHSRESMVSQLKAAIETSLGTGITGVLFYIDLDGFKEVNDTYGHDKGDAVLSEFAKRLKGLFVSLGYTLEAPALNKGKNSIFSDVRDNEKVILARLGGDEFTVHINAINSSHDAVTIAEAILEMLKDPFDISGRPITLGASIGLSFFPNDGKTETEVIKSADIAMYSAKEAGKNTFRTFHPSMNEKVVERMEIGNDLRAAVKNQEFIIYYQPLINAHDHSLKSVEALIRWKHPELGMVSPVKFIHIAEEIGLINEIGNIVVSKACEQSRMWLNAGFKVPIGVNVANRQFTDSDFPSYVLSVLKRVNLPGHFLELEITESSAMSGSEKFVSSLEPLRKQGVKFAIDDFGTGYSNIGQFFKMEFDTVKLDQSFVQNLHTKAEAKPVISTLLGMAKNLKIKTVAEGIETAEELKILTDMGCDVLQGYYFSKPLPADEFLYWLKKHNEKIAQGVDADLRPHKPRRLKIA